MALKTLTSAARSRRINRAKREADTFAIKVLLLRWCAMASQSATERYSSASAAIFYQTSLASRMFRSFKLLLQRKKECKRVIPRMVELIEISLVARCITPWRQYTKQKQRMDACVTEITCLHDQNIKNAVMMSWQAAYRYQSASVQIEASCQRFALRLAWERIKSLHRDSVQVSICQFVASMLYQKEALVQCAVLRDAVSTAFDYWQSAAKEKQAAQYRSFVLKYKSFSALKHNSERSSEPPAPSPTSDSSENNILSHSTNQNRIKSALQHKRDIITAAGLLTKAMHKELKRASLRALCDNSNRVAQETLKMQLVTEVCKKHTAKRTLVSWKMYSDLRKKKSSMKLLADLNYRGFLISHFFDYLRNRYLQRIEEFHKSLTLFKAHQRKHHRRAYFRAFLVAVERSRSLRTTRSLIEVSQKSQSLHWAWRRLEERCANNMMRKLQCIARIGSIKLDEHAGDPAVWLRTFREVKLLKSHDMKGLCNSLRETLLGPNILSVLTLPLRSECIVFLHYLSGLKTRAFELIERLDMSVDDAVVRVCRTLTSSELGELHSTYAYQLYVMRLEGFPQLNSLPESRSTEHSKQSIKALSPQLGNNSKLSGMVEPDDGVTGLNESVYENAPIATQGDSTNSPRSGCMGNLRDIPEWAVDLLQRLTAIKLLGVGDLRSQRCTTFDVLYSRLPVWRLLFTVFAQARCASTFRAWKKRSADRSDRRAKLSEMRNSVEGIFKISTRLEYFTRWLEVARICQEQRIADRNERCTTFTSILSCLVYRSVSIVFIRLHLTRLMAIHTGAERQRHMKFLSKAVVTSCRSGDASAEISAIRSYAVLRRLFCYWKMLTQWRVEVTSQTDAFYRDLFMRKGWSTIQSAFIERCNNRTELESSVKEEVTLRRLGHAFDLWCKTTRCKKALSSFLPSKDFVMQKCFNGWKSHVLNNIRLDKSATIIRKRVDASLLGTAVEGMLEHYFRRCALASLRSRILAASSKRTLLAAFTAWHGSMQRSKRLAALYHEMKGRRDIIEQEYVFSIMYRFSQLKQCVSSRLKRQHYVYMVISAATRKMSRTIEQHWAATQNHICRRFFELQRVMKNSEAAFSKITTGQSQLYVALLALSSLKETRIAVGLKALQQNVRYNIATKTVQQTHNRTLLLGVFRCWRRCVSFNLHTGASSQLSRHQLDGPKVLGKDGDVGAAAVNDNGGYTLTADAMERYCLVLACFKHWRNTALMLPGRNAAAIVEEFTTHNRMVDGIYLLKLHALASLWYRTCRARLEMLVGSMEDRMKWTMFHEWRMVARKKMTVNTQEFPYIE
ncbi:DNA gyrase subunit A, putative [Babesia ovata]|uniref:DNA gyrase subunit A, putative n=1 Tax=Babesia ovata TaxID=189622 RepID=A0A2H6KHG5_9APIC|nr:DNA gyrase subunit A, putative [Babesia ovata]GBE62436.1 DNA gyrase subunit A, putative [Babesia ovata]